MRSCLIWTSVTKKSHHMLTRMRKKRMARVPTCSPEHSHKYHLPTAHNYGRSARPSIYSGPLLTLLPVLPLSSINYFSSLHNFSSFHHAHPSSTYPIRLSLLPYSTSVATSFHIG